jgi:hypothetical protein
MAELDKLRHEQKDHCRRSALAIFGIYVATRGIALSYAA